MDIVKYIVIALIGGFASYLANSGVAVFNDGLRPIFPEFFDKRMDRKSLAATSFALSFGLVIGFGIPTSIGATIILIHCILLSTDIIGTMCPDSTTGKILSGVIGAVYGVAICFGLEVIVKVFGMMPYNFLSSLNSISGPINAAFAVFPAVAIGHQHGFKKGATSFGISFFVYILCGKFGTIIINEAAGIKFTLNPEGMALLAGVILMLIFAMQVKGDSTSNSDLLGMFSERVSRIKKNLIPLAIMGGLIAAGTSLLLIAGDPISLNLLKEGAYNEATLAAFVRAIGFIPLVFSTAIVTGVYGPAGTTFVFAVGLLFRGNPIVAFIAGAVVMAAEILLLNGAGKGMDKFPGIRDMGEHIRGSMNRVLEIALLVGSMMAAAAMIPGAGFLWVAGLYALNKTAKKQLVDIAVGPVAVISLGIILNILVVLGLWVAPVVG